MSPEEVEEYILSVPEEVAIAIGTAAVEAYIAWQKAKKSRENKERRDATRAALLKREAQIAQDIRDGVHVPRQRRKRDPETGELVGWAS